MTLTRSPLKRKTRLRPVSPKKPKRSGSWRNTKRDPVDVLSSKCVRARDRGECQAPWSWTKREGGPVDGLAGEGGRCPRTAEHWQIDSAHVFKRRYWGTRYNPDAQFALCKVCHDWSEQHKTEFEAWARWKMGEANYEWLHKIAHTPLHKLGFANKEELREWWRARLKTLLKEMGA